MYLGIGDPYFSKEQAAQALQLASAPAAATGTTSATGTTTTRGVPIRLRSAPRTAGVESAELALLPRLPDTADELMEIAKTLGADVVKDLLLHKDANEKKITTMNLADRRIIHFATHGLVPGELNGLNQPALALTAPEVAGTDGDGLLTMDKILALKLNADWVVLSACNTASGDGAGSEAVSGLGRAFFYAGARSLLVSNWPVDSLASRVMMADLFKRYAAGAPTAKADSLKAAMVALIDSPGFIAPDTGKPAYAYAHPMFWAPFVLVGDKGLPEIGAQAAPRRTLGQNRRAACALHARCNRAVTVLRLARYSCTAGPAGLSVVRPRHYRTSPKGDFDEPSNPRCCTGVRGIRNGTSAAPAHHPG